MRLPIRVTDFVQNNDEFIFEFLMVNGKDRYSFWFEEEPDTAKWIVPVYGELHPNLKYDGTILYDGVKWASMYDSGRFNSAIITGTSAMALYSSKEEIQLILNGTYRIEFTKEEKTFCPFVIGRPE